MYYLSLVKPKRYCSETCEGPLSGNDDGKVRKLTFKLVEGITGVDHKLSERDPKYLRILVGARFLRLLQLPPIARFANMTHSYAMANSGDRL